MFQCRFLNAVLVYNKFYFRGTLQTDLHVGPPKLSLDPNGWFNFHFFFKGVFMLLGMSIVIDISIKAGKAEDGGGIKMYFAFKWVNPLNGELLALVAGNFDLIPLDFSFIVSFDFGALRDTKLMMGLLIRPVIINKIMEVAEPAIKRVIYVFLYPVTLVIVGLLKALNYLIDALEAALKSYRKVVAVVKEKLQAFFAMAISKINAAQREIDKVDVALNSLKRKIDHEHYLCTEPCWAWWGWCCRRCFRVWGARICWPGFPVLRWTNSGCIWRMWRRVIACIALVVLWITWAVLMALKWIALAILEVVKALLKAIMFVIMLLLKIPELFMIAAMETLKAAAKRISLMIKPFAQFDLFKPCIGCITFDHECFWHRFMNKAVLLRIYEISVAMEFSVKTVTFSGTFHIIILSKEIDLLVSFSLSIQGLIDFFKTFVLKIFKEIMATIVNAFTCDTSVKSYEDETNEEAAAVENHAKALEADMDKAGHRSLLDALPSSGGGMAATLRANVAALGGARRRELPPDAAEEEAVREVRGYGPHARLWHPRAMDGYSLGESVVELGSLGGVGGAGGALGMTFVGNSAGDLDLMKVGSQAGELASRSERELHAHASLAAHVSALMSRAWPAHAAARTASADFDVADAASSSSSHGSDSRYTSLLGVDVRALRRAAEAPAKALVAAFDGLALEEEAELDGVSGSTRASGSSLRRALEQLLPDLGQGTRAAAEAAPEVFAACMPSPDAPLRAAAAALGTHAVGTRSGRTSDGAHRRLDIASRHENAGDSIAAHLGTSRESLDALHDENPTATYAAAAAALAAARDPCAVAGVLAALQCGALRAGVTTWGETMTGCVHALDILAAPKCTGGVEDDLLDSFPGSSANNAEGRAHNGLDPLACVGAATRHALPCSAHCGDGLLSVASACGGVVPRAGRWRHDAAPAAEAACSAAVTAAHDVCGAHSRACQAVLESAPLRDSLFFSTRPTRYAAAHRARQAKLGEFDISQDELATPADKLDWADQNVWGVVPLETCHDDRMELDARGNNLQGRPPSCAWEAARDGGTVLLSRNRLSGEVPPLAKNVAIVHVGFNRLEGDVGDVFGAAARAGLATLVANDNKFTSTDGLARIAGAPGLRNLDLSSNALGPAGSAELADHLASLTSLTHYDVGGNDWDHAAVARGAAAANATAAAAATAGHVALHVQITLPSSSALYDTCGACPNFDRDISGTKLGARSAIQTCMLTNGCHSHGDNVASPEDSAGNSDEQINAPNPRVFEALSCSLRAVLEPRLLHLLSDRLAADAADAAERDDDHVAPTPFAEAMETASKWRVEVVEAAQQAEASGDGFVVGYTLTPAVGFSSSSRSATEMVAKALDRLRHAAAAELSAAAEQCSGLHDAAASSGEDERSTAAAETVKEHLHQAKVDVRGACPTGRMGARCEYVCANEWHRTASHVAERGGYSLISGATLTGDANPTSGLRGARARTPPREMHPAATGGGGSTPSEMISRALITKGDAAAPAAGFRGSYAGAALGSGNADPAILGRAPNDMHRAPSTEGDGQYECSPEDAARGHCHHMDHWNPAVAHEFVGDSTVEASPRPVLAYELEHCTSTCRGHANLAVSDCKMWLVDKSHASHRSQCRDAVRDMLHTCKIHHGLYHKYGERHRKACAGKAGRAFARVGQEREEHESGCEVCGIVHYFEGHGLSDDDHHPDTGASPGSAFQKHKSFDMYDTDVGRQSMEIRAWHDSQPGREDPEWYLAHKTRGLEGHDDVDEVKAQHFEALLGFSPGSGGEDGGGGRGGGVSVFDHPAVARDDAFEHSLMFPTCSVHVSCSHRCYTHMHGVVMRRCTAWIDGDAHDSSRRAACQSAIVEAPASCEASERAMCVESVTAGFEALLERFPRAAAADGDAEAAGVRDSSSSSRTSKRDNENHSKNIDDHLNKVTSSRVTFNDSVTRMGASSKRKASIKASHVVGSSESGRRSQVDDESNRTVTTAVEIGDTTNPSTMFPTQMRGFLISLVALGVVGFVLQRAVSHFVAQQRRSCAGPNETEALLGRSSKYKGQYGTVEP